MAFSRPSRDRTIRAVVTLLVTDRLPEAPRLTSILAKCPDLAYWRLLPKISRLPRDKAVAGGADEADAIHYLQTLYGGGHWADPAGDLRVGDRSLLARGHGESAREDRLPG